eukprot:scaffold434113_cov51-Attheya_sp.AAC.1
MAVLSSRCLWAVAWISGGNYCLPSSAAFSCVLPPQHRRQFAVPPAITSKVTSMHTCSQLNAKKKPKARQTSGRTRKSQHHEDDSEENNDQPANRKKEQRLASRANRRRKETGVGESSYPEGSPRTALNTKLVQLSLNHPSPPRQQGDTVQQDSNASVSPSSSSSMRLWVSQVEEDAKWWEDSENPYGARMWPSSLGICQFLLEQDPKLFIGRNVLELGCGTGLVSMVAAKLGANVMATDISKVVLNLAQTGWQASTRTTTNTKKETTTTQQQQQQQQQHGTWTTGIFDLTSDLPLPLNAPGSADESSSPFPPLVLAGAVLYEADLAEVLARRVAEAVNDFGAWVIIGDDDTGQREGGRGLFEAELERLGIAPLLSMSTTTVKCKALSWNEKQVTLLHINSPLFAKKQEAAMPNTTGNGSNSDPL